MLCKDQFGCRYLQKQIEEFPSIAIPLIYDEINGLFSELMTDSFGNYLIQKLLEYCSETQKIHIISQVASELVSISLNMHGTRAVQKLIENVTDPVQVISNILIIDENHNHLIEF
jgi:hypothetical protein